MIHNQTRGDQVIKAFLAMADDFQARTCSSSWWSSPRSLFTGSSSPRSPSLSEMGSFASWSSCQDAASASGNHNIPIGLHGSHIAQASESVADSNVLIDSELPMSAFGLSSPTMDWNHSLAGSGRARSNYMRLQEDHLNTSQKLMQEGGAATQGIPSNSYSMSSSSFGYPSPFLQGLFEPDSLSHQSSFENQAAMSYNSSISSSNDQFQQSWPKMLPKFLKVSPPKQQASNQLHLSNSASSNFWNTMSDDKASLYSPPQCSPPQIFTNVFEEKPSCTNLSAVKRNGEEIRDSCSMTTKKATSSEASFKRPRVETPSPLPTFKVRKEKLGDRITALQQLVSPFGKTDTASVLYEAIEYIKFLHDQVNALSTPYMKNGAPMQQQQSVDHVVSSKDGDDGAKQGLLRRGLCLVPISSTFSVTNETTADFWTPTFGGTFR